MGGTLEGAADTRRCACRRAASAGVAAPLRWASTGRRSKLAGGQRTRLSWSTPKMAFSSTTASSSTGVPEIACAAPSRSPQV